MEAPVPVVVRFTHFGNDGLRALVTGDFDQLWVYIAGPIIGAILAIGCAAAIRPGVCCPPSNS